MTTPPRCPCGSGDFYAECCHPLHVGRTPAPTATALMRSRFSAFVRADTSYLLATWHPSTRPVRLDLDDRMIWTRLEIVDSTGGGPFDRVGVVEFRAHYRLMDGRPDDRHGGRRSGRPGELHERSSFLCSGGQWLYVSGDVRRS